nr:hypothetical protein [Tanacetum cinerariifolium]
MDEHNTKMQETVRTDKLKGFQHHLKEGKMCIQNEYWGTKLYLFVGNKVIYEDEYKEKSKNIATKISTASKNSTKDTFVNKHPIRNIAELLDVEQGVQSVIVGTVIAIQEDEGWWYLGYRAYRGRVIKSTDYIDLESEMSKNQMGLMIIGAKSAMLGFRLQIRVQVVTGTMSLSLFNDEVQAMVGRSAYQLCEKYAKSESDGSIPTKITNLIDNKYAFKVAIDNYNVKKLLPVFTILCFSNDQQIINFVLACSTPIKTLRSHDNEATSNTVLAITSLDLESQTDKNTTPNEKQKTNKRSAKGELGKKELMSNRKCESSKDKRLNPSVSSDAFLTDNPINGSLPPLSLSNRSSTQIYNIAGLALTHESQTDKNTTPNEKQKTNKRPGEGELGSESSTGKKKAVEIKVEKDA